MFSLDQVYRFFGQKLSIEDGFVSTTIAVQNTGVVLPTFLVSFREYSTYYIILKEYFLLTIWPTERHIEENSEESIFFWAI